ncbi:LuxR family transcriptional regulator [Salinibacterium sp. ZJ77]|uniref:helix-turn-helix transcriptional regulator n=1 Tax=Salinibacterium sp. ZJ77 TaxID=2708337 RepID=UPI001423D04D|nr:LuxR family transcriptional regulator [Salinibacterium sp. ZJ77]
MLKSHEQLLEAVGDQSRNALESALLLIGDVGSGKSSLLEEARRRDPGRVATVRVNFGEATWPLSGASALLGSLGDARVAAFSGRFTLREDVPLAEAAGELLVMLRGLALAPTTVYVDDIDRMDPTSRHLIGYMCGHLAGSGLRLVATAVAVPSDEPLAGVPRLDLPRLSDEDAAALAPRNLHPGTLRLLTWTCDGNVHAFTTQLASLTREQREGRDPLRFPLSPGSAARARLARAHSSLGPHQIEILERLAICPLHGHASVARWTPDAEDALQELLDAGVVVDSRGYVHLRDNLVRAAVAAGLATSRRRTLHTELQAVADPLVAPWHAASLAEPEKHRSALLDSAVQLAKLGRPGAAVEFADRAIRLGRGGLDRGLAALADALMLAGETELADRTLRQAELDADEHEELDRVGSRVAFATGRLSAVFDPADAADLDGTHTSDADANDPPSLAWAARRAILAGHVDDARDGIARLARAVERPSRVWSGWITALGIERAWRAGELAEAFELAREWDPTGRGGSGPECFVPIRVWTHLASDDLTSARAELREWSARTGSRTGALITASGLAFEAELARLDGDDAAALEHLLVADSIAASFEDPSLTRHLPDLIELLAAAERSTQAHEMLERLRAQADAHPSRWSALAVARARVALSTDDEARSAIESARGALATPAPGLGFERGRLHRAIAARLAALGAAAQAAAADADSHIAFASAGALPWVLRPTPPRSTTHPVAAIESGAPPAAQVTALPSAALVALTPDERSVVELVVRGLHNKEIAARLFVSVRTVELRLTHVYRKLGARSRSHLVALLR